MNSYYFYTETAFHHEGSFDYLIKLINASKRAGSSGVKFQVLLDVDDLVSIKHSQYDQLKKMTFSYDEWVEILNYCGKQKLDLIILPLDIQALDLVDQFKNEIKFLEIHPVLAKNENWLSKVKKTGAPLSIQIGGILNNELETITKYFSRQLKSIIVGFQSFPTKIVDVKLLKIKELKDKYPALEIGYADHSSFDDPMGIDIVGYAYLLGARLFEKHITLAKNSKKTDRASAVSEKDIALIIDKLDFIKTNIFDVPDLENLSEAEMQYRSRMAKVVAAENLAINSIIKPDDIQLRMIDQEGSHDIDEFVGKRLKTAISKGAAINKNQIT